MRWASSKRNQIKVKKLQQGLYSKFWILLTITELEFTFLVHQKDLVCLVFYLLQSSKFTGYLLSFKPCTSQKSGLCKHLV